MNIVVWTIIKQELQVKSEIMFADVEIIKIFPQLKFYVSPKIPFIEASGILLVGASLPKW